MSGRVYDDFLSVLFLHTNRETLTLVNEIPEESVPRRNSISFSSNGLFI
jgi:hypothetical protein